MNSSSTVPAQLLQTNPKNNYLTHKLEIDAAISRVLDSGSYILGSEVNAFEEEFSEYIGVRFAVGVGSGTEALHLALRACGVGVGDEVITVSQTAVATVAAVELSGAIPVLVDIDPETYTINPQRIEAAITPRTKVIIPVHLYGHPAEMDSIVEIAQRQNLLVIEDCAQSHGAAIEGRKVGGLGNMAAFSFYPTKNLGAIGDAGLLATDDREIAERARALREYGWGQRYISDLPGLNSRLDEIQAAILRTKLHFLDGENQQRQSVASAYADLLSETSLNLPVVNLGISHVFHQYVVRSNRRDSLKEFLEERRIFTSIHYPLPIHLQPAYEARSLSSGPMVATEEAAKEILSLPIFPEMSTEQVRYVAGAISLWDIARSAK